MLQTKHTPTLDRQQNNTLKQTKNNITLYNKNTDIKCTQQRSHETNKT